MNLVSEAQTDVLTVDDAAIDDDGAVYWFTWDPMANDASARQLWTLAPGGSATKVGGPVAAGPYVGLTWQAAASSPWKPTRRPNDLDSSRSTSPILRRLRLA
jgi:hypothetical protein